MKYTKVLNYVEFGLKINIYNRNNGYMLMRFNGYVDEDYGIYVNEDYWIC